MRIVDFHAHIYPDEVAEKVISRMEEFYGVKRRHQATVEGLLGSMGQGEVSYAVILPVATRPEHLENNAWYASLRNVSSKIVPFGAFFPGVNLIKEVEIFPRLGLKGFKVQPNAWQCYPDDKRLWPLYRLAQDLNLIAVFHVGNEEGGIFGEYSQPERYLKVLESFPTLTCVLSHLGGFKTWDKVDLFKGFPNAYFDTAYVPGEVSEAFFQELVEQFGPDKILFGTDFPFRDHAEEVAYLQKVIEDKKKYQQIMEENALNLLRIC